MNFVYFNCITLYFMRFLRKIISLIPCYKPPRHTRQYNPPKGTVVMIRHCGFLRFDENRVFYAILMPII